MTLLLKALVPAGYMVGTSGGAVTIEMCSGYGPMKMTIAMPGLAHPDGKQDRRGKEMPCAFSGLAAPSLAGADPLLLAPAILFIIATVFRAADRTGPPDEPAFLRPPPRGPPSRG